MNRGEVAAAFMKHLCECEYHGYSWEERFGDGSAGSCYVEYGGVTGEFYKGDRDCSSSVIDAWSEALKGSAYEGALSGATYTGNMRDVFCGSGLFEWRGMDYTAQAGDVYLNIENHTAMCISAEPDLLGEFSINENGGCYGGQRGDQTGAESSVHAYYDFPWDGILAYNHAADGEDGGSYGAAEQPAQESPSASGAVRYRAMTREHGWLDWMEGTHDTGGSGDDYAGVEGCWIYAFECDRDFQLTLMDGTLLPVNASNEGGAQAVRGVTIFGASYQAHFCGAGWGKVEDGDCDGGAGDDVHALDMVRVF